MRIKHTVVIRSCIRIKGKTDFRPQYFFFFFFFFFCLSFQGGCSVAVPFVCASVVSYVVFVLSFFVPHLTFFWCLGKAVFRDCGISWVSSLIFLLNGIHFIGLIKETGTLFCCCCFFFVFVFFVCFFFFFFFFFFAIFRYGIYMNSKIFYISLLRIL